MDSLTREILFAGENGEHIGKKDALFLRYTIEGLEKDIANLSAVLEDALVFEVGVTFPEEEAVSE